MAFGIAHVQQCIVFEHAQWSGKDRSRQTSNHTVSRLLLDLLCLEVVSSGGAPTPACTSVFTKHNWDMGMGYLLINGWDIYHLMGGAFMAYWVGHL